MVTYDNAMNSKIAVHSRSSLNIFLAVIVNVYYEQIEMLFCQLRFECAKGFEYINTRQVCLFDAFCDVQGDHRIRFQYCNFWHWHCLLLFIVHLFR